MQTAKLVFSLNFWLQIAKGYIMGMGSRNTKVMIKMLIFWLILVFLIVMASGCSEYGMDITAVEDISNFRENDDKLVEECRGTYYVDPYTKLKYCLPEDLIVSTNLDVPVI